MENGFYTEAHSGFVLDSEQKIKMQLQTIWPWSCFKRIEKWYGIENTYELDLSLLALCPAILDCEKSKKTCIPNYT